MVSSIMESLETWMTDQGDCKVTSLSNGLRDTDEGIIYAGQCQNKGKKNMKKNFMFSKLMKF